MDSNELMKVDCEHRESPYKEVGKGELRDFQMLRTEVGQKLLELEA